MKTRNSSIERETKETKVSVTLNLDGDGQHNIQTGNGTLDHLIAQLSRHGLIDITIKAQGDVETGWHHLVEDVAIVFGKAFRGALKDGVGIRRMAHSVVPLDEALASVSVDLSRRGHASLNLSLSGDMVDTLPGDLVRHFLESFAHESKITLHCSMLSGINSHHKAEALFKALARALREASELDPRHAGIVPSTKGTIEG